MIAIEESRKSADRMREALPSLASSANTQKTVKEKEQIRSLVRWLDVESAYKAETTQHIGGYLIEPDYEYANNPT